MFHSVDSKQCNKKYIKSFNSRCGEALSNALLWKGISRHWKTSYFPEPSMGYFARHDQPNIISACCLNEWLFKMYLFRRINENLPFLHCVHCPGELSPIADIIYFRFERKIINKWIWTHQLTIQLTIQHVSHQALIMQIMKEINMLIRTWSTVWLLPVFTLTRQETRENWELFQTILQG